jgi:hypothetical protein
LNISESKDEFIDGAASLSIDLLDEFDEETESGEMELDLLSYDSGA